MTFRRLAPNTHPAESFEAARNRALSLYREWLREVHELIGVSLSYRIYLHIVGSKTGG